MKKIFVANFKMNKTNPEVLDYIQELNNHLLESLSSDVCLCLPYTSLCLGKFLDERIAVGAQNMHEEDFGPFTGEISADMLCCLGVKYVIIGHSERRKYFNETNEKINKKIKTALRHGLKVVLCVGETKVQRNSKRTTEILSQQIESALSGIFENELKGIIIAYEPVWAIGTGKVASSEDIEEAVKTIRKLISSHYSKQAAQDQKILYGGSLTSGTAKSILKIDGICGALVGGASLDPNEFIKIIS